jgi:hypothetical protein
MMDQPMNTGDSSDGLPSKAGPKSVAERMRAYRRRRRSGLRCAKVRFGRADLDGLVEKGYLSPDKRKDLHAIELAIEDFLFDCFTRAFRNT